MNHAPRRIAFLTAHPDDHEMMLSYQMLAALAAGQAVFAYVATDGEATTVGDPEFVKNHGRRAESQAGLASLGVPANHLHYAALADGALSKPEQTTKLQRDITTFLRTHHITTAITLGPDGGDHHPDHIAVHNATMAATAKLAQIHHPVAVWGLNAAGQSHHTTAAHGHLPQKLAALACHKSQFPLARNAADIPSAYHHFLQAETYDQCFPKPLRWPATPPPTFATS
jgi:LmbE family N-acetylglucosaminyl deacetylase